MPIFNQANVTAAQVAQTASMRLANLRNAAYSARDICGWVVSQQAGDLEAIGFDLVTEVPVLVSSCQNILNLITFANGGPAPDAPGLNYFDNAMGVIGPQ